MSNPSYCVIQSP